MASARVRTANAAKADAVRDEPSVLAPHRHSRHERSQLSELAASGPSSVLALQRLVGNRAAVNLIAGGGPASGVQRLIEPRIQRASNRLYVGNLSFNTSQETVQAAFAAIGEVREVAMPTDRETGQPRGMAFVTMGDAQAGSDAISRLNGTMLDGRPLRVNEAQERPPRGGGGGGGGFGGGGGGGRGGGGRDAGGRGGGGRDRY